MKELLNLNFIEKEKYFYLRSLINKQFITEIFVYKSEPKVKLFILGYDEGADYEVDYLAESEMDKVSLVKYLLKHYEIK